MEKHRIPRPGLGAASTRLRRALRAKRADREAAKDPAGLQALEAQVAGALPWDPVNARLLAQELMLRRLALLER